MTRSDSQGERRVSSRVGISVPAEIVWPAEPPLTAVILDISRGGVQILCGEPVARAVRPRPSSDDHERVLRVRFELPFLTDEAAVETDVRCHIARVDEHDDGGCALGLKFAQFTKGGFDSVERHVLERGRFN